MNILVRSARMFIQIFGATYLGSRGPPVVRKNINLWFFSLTVRPILRLVVAPS